jgi:hypothetical protein
VHCFEQAHLTGGACSAFLSPIHCFNLLYDMPCSVRLCMCVQPTG